MANVLGELFGNIANAIREKTGDTATMKPADFPDKIAAIEAGGSGGTVVAAKGFFTGTGGAVTVTHNLGTVPMFVWCFPTAGLNTNTADSGAIRVAAAINAEAAEAAGMTGDMQLFLYWNKAAGSFAASTPDYPIEDTGGIIRSATETTFVVGDGRYPNTGSEYTWVAVGVLRDE